ncbi:MAG: glycine cleavage system aminomethyltransferase GcvT [Ectothiorhodospiraceae bacterium]|nr:glycine cleavage system aminomethyltransferase GcvT [Ectothiorhodospiraceae bacterium]
MTGSADATTALAHTPLHALHEELGGRMVAFAGHALPVQYPSGIMSEHRHTRDACSLFDVSHMGQLRLPVAAAGALEALVPTDVLGLASGRQRYTFLTTDDGGILDDLMVARLDDALIIVCNAANKAADVAHLEARLGAGAGLRVLDDRALLALQGPGAETALAALAPGAAGMRFMDVAELDVGGHTCVVSRSGYTGEDGYEISVAADAAIALARALLAREGVAPAGLGARDSLRLEAGLCLHGHDIDTTTSPVEAGLTWAIPRVRRAGGARAGGFAGSEVVLGQIAGGTSRRRVGIRPAGRAPVREGAVVVGTDGAEIGRVTSGGFGPTVRAPVAMGYVAADHAADGSELGAVVRGETLPAVVAPLPFVAHRYRR